MSVTNAPLSCDPADHGRVFRYLLTRSSLVGVRTAWLLLPKLASGRL